MPEDPPWRLISPRDAVASRFPFTWLEGGAPSGRRSLDINNNSFDMYSKEQLTNSLVHECNVCKHLFTKLSGEGYEYRPTPGQRSSVELLRYLAVIGIASITGFAESNWEAWRPFAAEVENMTAEEFPAAMDRQIERIRGVMAGLTDEQLATQEAKLPNGTVTNLGAAIIDGTLKWLTAYKMQLFLYAKAAGAHEIGTANCWGGIDWKPSVPVDQAIEEEA